MARYRESAVDRIKGLINEAIYNEEQVPALVERMADIDRMGFLDAIPGGVKKTFVLGFTFLLDELISVVKYYQQEDPEQGSVKAFSSLLAELDNETFRHKSSFSYSGKWWTVRQLKLAKLEIKKGAVTSFYEANVSLVVEGTILPEASPPLAPQGPKEVTLKSFLAELDDFETKL